MLKSIMLVFIISLPGKPDIYQPQVYARSLATTSCENEEYIQPALHSWAISVAANHPRVTVNELKPEYIKHVCYEMDHIDPDTQPDETGA